MIFIFYIDNNCDKLKEDLREEWGRDEEVILRINETMI